MHTIVDKKLVMLRPEEIKRSANQPRREFDSYELELLAESISASGIIQPLAVRRCDDGKYELIAGERRLRASIMAGIRRIPCVIHKIDDQSSAVYSLIENLQRKNLNFFEEASGIERLITLYGMSQSEASVRLGMAQSTLSNKLRLLRLDDELKKILTDAGLSERYARALLRIKAEGRKEVLLKIIAEEMNIRCAEEFIENIINPKPETEQKNEIIKEQPKAEPPKPYRKSAIGDVRLFSNSLSKLLDTLQSAGIDAHSRKYENDKYIEYKVRIKKEIPENYRAEQLKIC